jgi:hypothetical protein
MSALTGRGGTEFMDAPATLRDRMLEALEGVQGGAGPGRDATEALRGELGEAGSLADAALDSLRRVLAATGDRGTALDLLAADALLTQACEVAAASGPEELIEFTRMLLARIEGLE